MATAIAVPRRSKRRKVDAMSASQHPLPPALTQSDSAASTSVVLGSSSAAPGPAQASGPVCNLLNTDGTRCHHRLSPSKSVNQKHANTHKRAGANDPGFRCTFLGCNSTVQYATKCSRNKHIFDHHWGYRFPCDVQGCTKVYGREDELARHKRSKHGQ
ncbi:hypothetical protein C8Q73DRAFT_416948 [Cubamyces lactineus]|nr:hypothetical protein C8Q73DRAFT_416948 [Cubamyces lactineus]